MNADTLLETQSVPASAAHRFPFSLLDSMAMPDYKSRDKLIEMNIDDFLRLCRHGFSESKLDNVRSYLATAKKFTAIAFLEVDHDGQVDGHEGRHRAMVLKEMGYKTMPVVMRAANLRWSEQCNPGRFDFLLDWPVALRAEAGAANEDFRLPFPVAREDAMTPYRAHLGLETAAPSVDHQINPIAQKVSAAVSQTNAADFHTWPPASAEDMQALQVYRDRHLAAKYAVAPAAIPREAIVGIGLVHGRLYVEFDAFESIPAGSVRIDRLKAHQHELVLTRQSMKDIFAVRTHSDPAAHAERVRNQMEAFKAAGVLDSKHLKAQVEALNKIARDGEVFDFTPSFMGYSKYEIECPKWTAGVGSWFVDHINSLSADQVPKLTAPIDAIAEALMQDCMACARRELGPKFDLESAAKLPQPKVVMDALRYMDPTVPELEPKPAQRRGMRP